MTIVPHHEIASGAPWLRERRRHAAAQLAETAWPTAEDEIWRYSRIGELDVNAFTPRHDVGVIPAEVLAQARSLEPSALVITVDGVLALCELDERRNRQTLFVGPARSADDLGRAMNSPTDVFASMNDALAHDPIVVDVRRGGVIDGPIVVVHLVTTEGVLAAPRLAVIAGENSELTVVERFVSTDVAALCLPVTELRAEASARLKYLAINEHAARVWQIASAVSVGERDSTTTVGAVALGGDYARLRIDARLAGQGAHTDQIAVYFGEATQMHDFRTLQDHAAPKTTSNLLFKGAVEGHARSVYTGLIKVRKEAVGTSAFQTNRNIKLSEGAWAESVPNLDIETNDVQCSHASAVGPIDPDQRFYLESRGVPSAIAERLIVLGFFDEVLDRLPEPTAIAPLRLQVAGKLERRTP